MSTGRSCMSSAADPAEMREGGESAGGDAAERFDSDFVMMAGELSRLLAELLGALGLDVEAKAGKAGGRAAQKLAA